MTNFSRKILSATLALLLVAEQLMTGVLAFSDLGSVDGEATDPAPVVASADAGTTASDDTATDADTTADAGDAADSTDADAADTTADQADTTTGAAADSADADTTTADIADQTDVATGATTDTADTADQDTATDTADQADTTTGADTVLDGADDALLTPLAATTPLFSMMTRAAQGGSVKVDVATRTAAGETPRTEYRVGEQIETNAVIDNSGLGATLNARGRITLPKKYLSGNPVFVQEKSMRDWSVTSDADNWYVDFKITVDDGKKMALPIYFTIQNKSTVPQGFETPLTFQLYDEATDDLIDEHTTIYKAKVQSRVSRLSLYNFHDKGYNNDHGTWGVDDNGNPRLTARDYMLYYSGFSAQMPDTGANYTGWSNYFIYLESKGDAPSGLGISNPEKVRMVMNLPEGTRPMANRKNANGLYCSSYHMNYCWVYDEQARTLTYEGPLHPDGYVFTELEHIDQPHYLDADKTQVNYHEVTTSITANPDGAYAQEYGPHTVSIGWTPRVHEIVPGSTFHSGKSGLNQSVNEGLTYTDDHDDTNLFYNLGLWIQHTLANQPQYHKAFIAKGIRDYGLDDKLYYKKVRWTTFNRTKEGRAQPMPEHKIYGVHADGSEVLLGENLALNQDLEINDTSDEYIELKVVFDTEVKTTSLSANLYVYVGVKDGHWETIAENAINRFDGTWDVNGFVRGTKYNDNKLFNLAKFDYLPDGATDMQTHTLTGFLRFKKDYMMVHGERINGHHVVAYNLDPTTMVRDITTNVGLRKADHDGSAVTDYAKRTFKLDNAKYIVLLPEGVNYVPDSVKATRQKDGEPPLAEPAIVPNYKETGKTALIFDVGDITHERFYWDWRHGTAIKFKVQVTNDTREGENWIESFFAWEAASGLVDNWNTFVDKYDFDNDGNLKEKFLQINSTRITYTQRKDIILKNSLSSTQTGNYASTALLDKTTENPYYKFNLFNNYIEDMQGISMIATLPAKGDTAIAPDQDGNYVARGSDLSLYLKKSLESDPANAGLLAGWDFFYSTDPLGTSIEERKNANWLSADQIDDFSKVTMIKMQQKPGALLRQKQNIDFYAPMALPADMPEVNKMLVASASTAFSTNGNSYIESNKITFSFTPGYQVEGKVFADLNDDGALTGDTLLEGYTVALMNRDGTPVLDADGVALTTQTNAGGSFFFKVPKRGEYYLSLTKKYANDRAAKLYEIDGTRTIGSGGNDAIADDADATAMTLKTELFSLNPYAPSSVDNVYEKPSSFVATRNFGLVPQNGQIKITLHDAENTDKAIAGGVFALYNQQGDELGQFTTDASGVVLSGLMPFATYKIKQLSTTDSYMLPTEEIEFTTSTLIHTVPVFNKIKKAELNISLTAAEDKNLPLANGVYELKDANGKLIATLTTDEKGKANMADLPYGKYTLTQITAPKNYTLSPVVTEIVIDAPSKEYPLTNARKNGTVTLTLKDSRNTKLLLEKGEFAITDTNGNHIATITPDMLVTNKDGTITLPNLPYGDYIIKQTKAPTRYRLNDAPIKVALYDENVDLTHLNQKRPTDTPPPPADPVPDPKPEPTPDPKPTDPIIEIIPQDPKPIEPTTPKGPDFTDPIVYRPVEKPTTDTLPATAQPAIKKYVKTLPKTGAIGQAQIDKKAGVVSASARKKIETRLPSEEIFRLAGDKNKSLSHWLAVLPESERVASQYIVLPTQGLVMPVQTVASGSKAYNNFTNGIAEDFASYLHNGAVQLPGVSLGSYGDAGNKVIAGHSSYRKSSKAKYKTHFQKIIGMESGEEIRIYKKTAKGTFIRYVYKVHASYNTDDQDVSVLKPTHADQLTLITCTPIGGVAGRWVVKATFQGH